MKQDSSITRSMAAAQEAHAATRYSPKSVLYRIYTAYASNLPELTARYFSGATFLDTLGIWQGVDEQGAVIEIIGTRADLQSITHLAGDIKQVNSQTSVLVTWQAIERLDV